MHLSQNSSQVPDEPGEAAALRAAIATTKRVSSARRALDSVAAVVLAVACFYVGFTVLGLRLHGGNPLWFLWLGERFANLDPGGRTGYDGQFAYYIARDWTTAVPHLDNPPYRLQRVLHPLVARLLSLAWPELIPWTLILVNLVALIAAACALAKWLSSQKVSPWYTLTYSLYVGLFLAYSRALTEPLAFALAACGLVAWLRRNYPVAVVLLALGALGKETILLLVFGVAIAEASRRRYLPALAVLAGSSLPLLAWEAWLFGQFRVVPFAAGPSLELVPLNGILPYLNAEPGRVSAFVFVALPAALLAVASLTRLAKHHSCPLGWLLVLQSIFVLMMPFPVYDHIMAAGRNAAGLALAWTLAIPSVHLYVRKPVSILWVAPTSIWLVPVLRWAPWLSPT